MAEGLDNVHALPTRDRLRVVERDAPGRSEWSNEDLMLAHCAGDEAAYVMLLQRHQRGVLNFVYRMVNNRQVAEELTQEVFIALVKNAGRYQPTAKFTTYLYTIASNIISKEWARQKRRPRLFSLSAWWSADDDDSFNPLDHIGDDAPNPALCFQRGEVSEAVNAALNELPAHQREAFVLRRFQDMPYDEIAAVLQVPVGTVKSRVVRAEHALRPHLERFREYL